MRWLKWTLAAAMALGGCKEPNNVMPPDVAPIQPVPARQGDAEAGPALTQASTAPSEGVSTAPATGAATEPEAPSPVTLTTSDLAPDGPVMALVNGKPIGMKALHEILVRDHGMSVAYQLIADELVRQEAIARKISVTKADLQKETDAVLRRALGELPAPNQRERILQELMSRLDVSPGMWDVLMQRQALLRKLVEPDVKVTDDELKEEFNLQYDRKVTVRDIQTATVADAEKALKALNAEGDKLTEDFFAELARKVSTGVTASTGGLLSPMTAKSPMPPAIREAAMRFKKPLDMSGIVQSGTTFHILLCSKVEEPQDAKFDQVRGKLFESVHERHVAELQQQRLGALIQNARKAGKIEFIDPTLKAQDAQPPAAGP